MRIRLRAELDPFYRDMGLWNRELASLIEQWRRHPEARTQLRGEFSRLKRAIEIGRNRALKRAEQIADGQPNSIWEDADRASALLLRRLDEAMQ